MTEAQPRTRLLWHLVEESLSEASYLWTRLDAALDAHEYTIAEVQTWVEGRLLGALDGVLIAGANAIEPLLVPGLQSPDHGTVSVAAYALSLLSSPAADRALEAGLREVAVDAVPAFARGLGRAGQIDALHKLWARVEDAPPPARAVVLEALSFCGRAPDAAWHKLLMGDEPLLGRAAASALRFLPPGVLDTVVDHGLYAEDVEIRNRAICGGVAAGDAPSWQRCLALVRSQDLHCGALLPLVAILGSQRDHQILMSALSVPELCTDALWALGFVGTVDAAEACLAQLRSGMFTAQAAEAFCFATGLDLAREKLVQAEQEVERDALDEDALDVSLEPTADAALPLPDVEGLHAWWAKHKASFARDARYQLGKSASWSGVRDVLEHGSTRRRHALALELGARSGGACLLQPLALTRTQSTQLGILSAISEPALRNISRALGFAALATA